MQYIRYLAFIWHNCFSDVDGAVKNEDEENQLEAESPGPESLCVKQIGDKVVNHFKKSPIT